MTTSTAGAVSTEPAVRTVGTVMAAVRDVAARAATEAVDRERHRRSPRDLVRALADAGLGAVRVPEQFGGAGASVTDLAELLLVVAAADSNLTQLLRGHLGFVEFLLARPADEVRDDLLRAAGRGELFGPAASVRAVRLEDGTRAARIIDASTTLTRDGDRLVLTGEKYYTTGSLHSDWINVLVVDADGPAEVVVRADAPGVSVADDWNGFGQRLTASGTARFDAVEVRPDLVFRHDVEGVGDLLTAFYQFVHTATQAGIVRRAADDLADVVRARHRTYPLAPDQTVPPRHDPQVLEVVGQVEAAARTTAASVRAVAIALDRYVVLPTGPLLIEATIESAAAQVSVTQITGEALWRFFDAASASSTDSDLALDRHWRNARTVSSHNPVIYKARLVGNWVVNRELSAGAL